MFYMPLQVVRRSRKKQCQLMLGTIVKLVTSLPPRCNIFFSFIWTWYATGIYLRHGNLFLSFHARFLIPNTCLGLH